MRILLIGGSGTLGPSLVAEAVRAGHELTVFNRGGSDGPAYPEGVLHVVGDRRSGLGALAGERWDAVIDSCGYLPADVRRTIGELADRGGRYLYVSSESVYDIDTPGPIDEDSARLPLPEGAGGEYSDELYGPLKSACEQAALELCGERATIVRPGLIVGPWDRTERFAYWLRRADRGGELLAPGPPSRAAQFVDGRDVAWFCIRLLERDHAGIYNVDSQAGALTMGDVVEAALAAAGRGGTAVWVDDAFLLRQGVGPWIELPLWIPDDSESQGFFAIRVDRALAAGLTLRPFEETVRDTLAWTREHAPAPTRKGAALTADRERELIAAWRAEAGA